MQYFICFNLYSYSCGVIIFIGVCVYSFIQGLNDNKSANNSKNNYQNGADNDDYLYYHFTKED